MALGPSVSLQGRVRSTLAFVQSGRSLRHLHPLRPPCMIKHHGHMSGWVRKVMSWCNENNIPHWCTSQMHGPDLDRAERCHPRSTLNPLTTLDQHTRNRRRPRHAIPFVMQGRKHCANSRCSRIELINPIAEGPIRCDTDTIASPARALRCPPPSRDCLLNFRCTAHRRRIQRVLALGAK